VTCFTQEQVASILGIDQTTVSKNTFRNVKSAKALERIATLNISNMKNPD